MNPDETASRESIFPNPTSIGARGTCLLGSSLSCFIPNKLSAIHKPGLSKPQLISLLEIFANEKYILWFDTSATSSHPILHVCLKEGHVSLDHLKGWIHAQQVVTHMESDHIAPSFDARLSIIRDTLDGIEELFPAFVKQARAAGWRVDEGALLAGSPKTISVREGD